jgi:hypothetical protein
MRAERLSARRCAVRLGLALAALAPFASAHAQGTDDRVTVDQGHAWFTYAGEHPLRRGAPTALHLEAQVRRADLGEDWQQLLLRAGVTRAVASGVRVGGGYGFIQTHTYGELPAAADFPEHRGWQQLSLSHGVGRLGIGHRYRLEQRWVGRTGTDAADPERVTEWRYSNRARYMGRVTLPLRREAQGAPYLYAANEVFVSFGENVQMNRFDQNRLMLGVGRPLSSVLRAELGYLNQYVVKGNGREFERNHTVQLTLSSSAPLGF